jgi:hypothetical protein
MLMENHQDYIWDQELLLYHALEPSTDKDIKLKLPTEKEIKLMREVAWLEAVADAKALNKPKIKAKQSLTRKINQDMSKLKHNFFNKFYLFDGLLKLRGCENYKHREDLYQKLNT